MLGLGLNYLLTIRRGGEHQVPAVEAVAAAVGNHVAYLPEVVLGWVGEQVAGAAAIHAGN